MNGVGWWLSGILACSDASSGRPAETGVEGPRTETEFVAGAACAAPPVEPARWTLRDPGSSWRDQPPGGYGDLGGWGLAVDDFDGDGHLDVFLPHHGGMQLFLGDGRGVLRAAHDRLPELVGDHVGATSADVDADGDADLLVAVRGGANLVLTWTGERFTLANGAHETWGTEETATTRHLAVADVDDDGVLDAFATRFYSHDSQTGEDVLGRHELFRGLGDGRFRAIAGWFPEEERFTPANTSGFVDVNLDGRAELFVVNDKPQRFTSRVFARDAGGPYAALPESVGLHARVQGMGLAEGDWDADGDFDYALSGWGDVALLVQEGDTWVDAARAHGVTKRDDAPVGWGLDFVDLDVDGHPELLLANGPEYAGDGMTIGAGTPNPVAQPWTVFRRPGAERADEVAEAWGFVGAGNRRGFVAADLDEDGVPEVIARNLLGRAEVWGRPCTGRGWLDVRLDMPGRPNHRAIGANVRVVTRDGAQVRGIRAGTATIASGEPPRAWFGLGDGQDAHTVDVVWPDGVTTSHEGPWRDGLLVVRRMP
ncbi:MAG: hypothetical protein RLZZ299_2360 [Pseudomonadota bacterium]|jgi:hypothetical protein